MRLMKFTMLALVLTALVVAPASAGCGKCGGHAEEAKADAAKKEAGCCSKTDVAKSAGDGCTKSQAKLVAMAKDSGCEKTAALAAKAEAGDEKAMQALIAKNSGCSKSNDHHGAETAMLASNAKNGCSKSTAKLVAMAKDSGCSKGAAIAARVEEGDESAKQELIAMFESPESNESE